METTLRRSWGCLGALALNLLLSACAPPPEPAAAPLPVASVSPASVSNDQAASKPAPVQCGADWCAMTDVPKQVTLSAVWGSSPTDVWLAGEGGTLLHWNGAAWSEAASGTTSGLRALAGTSAKDVWAAGLDGALLHFDGSSWSTTQRNGQTWSPATGPNERPIYTLLALPKQLWAGGSGTRSFDGAAWTDPHHSSHLATTALWGLDSSTVWEVGLQGMVNRWSSGHPKRLGGEVGPNYLGVWGSSADDVWVVGSGGAITHFIGEKPTSVASGTTNDLYAVRGFSQKDLWAVGGAGTILHWQGTAWAPSKSPSSKAVLAIWGSSAVDVWLVGEDGVVLRHAT